MKLFCIGDEDTVRGFRLAGVAGQAAINAQQAAAAFEQAAAQTDCAILILTERVAAGIRQQVDAFQLQRSRPLVVVVPGPEGPLAARKSMRQLVQEAVGISVGAEEKE